MKQIIGTAILIIFFSSNTFCQGNSRANTTREIIINSGDTIVVANILLDGRKIKTNIRRTYYWYMREKICHNTGDYSGKLLDGQFQVFIRDKMILSGNYEKGLRDGKWIEWDLKGSITNITVYKKGTPCKEKEKKCFSNIVLRKEKGDDSDKASKQKVPKHQKHKNHRTKD